MDRPGLDPELLDAAMARLEARIGREIIRNAWLESSLDQEQRRHAETSAELERYLDRYGDLDDERDEDDGRPEDDDPDPDPVH